MTFATLPGVLSLLIVSAAGLALPSRGSAQEPESVWIGGVTGTAQNESVEGAKESARLDAYGQALTNLGIPFDPARFAVQAGAGESAEALRRANDAFLLVLRGRSAGFVSGVRNAKSVIREEVGSVFCTTTLDAKITRPRGTADPAFYVKLVPDQGTVRVGDNVRIRAVPSKESFLYLFHVMSDGVRVIYPPAITSGVPLPAGSEITVPSSTAIPWLADLPDEWESSEELIVAVATKRKIPEEEWGVVNPEGYRSAREGALVELMGWLNPPPR